MKKRNLGSPASWHEMPGRAGFTLMELLAVIATMAILAALLVPSGFKMLRSSKKVECLANFRILHAGLSQYAGDHNGFFPAPTDNLLPTGGTGSWTMALMMGDYVGCQAVSANVKNPFLCPAARSTYSGGLARRTYGMNTLPFTAQPVSIYKLTSPARTLILADCIQSVDLSEHDAIMYFRTSSIARVEERHEGRFQGLFADGHTELLKKSDAQTVQYIDNLQQ